MIIYGGVDGKRHVLSLIDHSGEYQVSQCEQRPALTYIAGIHMILSYGHGSLGHTGFYIGKLNTYIFGELVTIIKKFFKCHCLQLFGCKGIQKNDGINKFLSGKIHWDYSNRTLMTGQVLQQAGIGNPCVTVYVGADTRTGIS